MKLFEFVPEGVVDCKVTAWIHTNHESKELKHCLHPAIVICPGGGYGGTSDTEAETVSRYYFAEGYNTFILRYSTNEDAKNFKPLSQLASTVSHIRKNGAEWYTAEDKIAVCGFSAGGHLAASLGTLHNNEKFLEVYGRTENIRPNAMVLCYPVILADEYAHVGSIENVSGASVGTKEYQWFGLDQHVDRNTPPAFLWHTAEDSGVPVENSLKMATALSKAKVPFEIHVFPEGPHGMSVCTNENGRPCKYNHRWIEWSIQWLNRLFQWEV